MALMGRWGRFPGEAGGEVAMARGCGEASGAASALLYGLGDTMTGGIENPQGVVCERGRGMGDERSSRGSRARAGASW
ncbi:hypothetical protein HYQ46_013243 [Verticillium longisporum]|nr:hypothetical protein HYQ46_013243 [Verticillium longisporum]